MRGKAYIGHHSLNPHCEFNDNFFLVRSLQSFSLCFPIFSVYTYIHNLCKKYSEICSNKNVYQTLRVCVCIGSMESIPSRCQANDVKCWFISTGKLAASLTYIHYIHSTRLLGPLIYSSPCRNSVRRYNRDFKVLHGAPNVTAYAFDLYGGIWSLDMALPWI